MKLTWDDLFRSVNLIGCDIETREGGRFYRGPISTVVHTGGHVQIQTAWLASRPVRDGCWVEDRSQADILCGGATDFIQGPFLQEQEGYIGFSLPYIGSAKIYLRGPRLIRRMVPVFALETRTAAAA